MLNEIVDSFVKVVLLLLVHRIILSSNMLTLMRLWSPQGQVKEVILILAY